MRDSRRERKVKQIIEEHCEYALKLAREFRSQREGRFITLDIKDLESAALLGLCEAGNRYNFEMGVQFKTFAYLRIRGAMYDLIRQQGGLSRGAYKKLKDSFESSCDFDSDSEIPERGTGKNFLSMSWTRRDLVSATNSQECLGISLNYNNEKQTVDVCYRDEQTPEDLIAKQSTSRYLSTVLDTLNPKERKLIESRYFKGKSGSEIATELGGGSRSWVSRLHVKALDSIRDTIASQTLAANRRVEEACLV